MPTVEFSLEFQTAAEWKSWLDGGKVLPLFQPIFFVEDQSVFGWESFGRLDLSGSLASLGPFFRSQADAELLCLKREVGADLARQAVRATGPMVSRRLFFNALPTLLTTPTLPGELPYPVQALANEGLDPSQVVVEISDEPRYKDYSALKEVVESLRGLGCSIALDDVGSGSSHLDRIAFLRPDIIKVNLTLFERSFRDRHFRRDLGALSRLAETLGASLLVEGIESPEELQHALHFGARYLQGFFFSLPVRTPVVDSSIAPRLRHSLENFNMIRSRRVQRQVAWENEMLLRLVDIGFSIFEVDGVVHVSEEDLVGLSGFANRLYFTDLGGVQISYDYLLDEQSYRQDRGDLGRNLCLRPFFFDHIYKLHGRPGGWSLSDVYLDFPSKCQLRTFSRQISSRAILFLDVPWSNFADL